MIVVCDFTILIGLAKINRLELLRYIYEEIYVPVAVFAEVVDKSKGRPGGKEITESNWIKKEEIRDKRAVEILLAEFGPGEAEVLILGKELNADWLIIDDEKARTAAISAGFQVIGLVGVLLLSKRLNLISLIKPLLEELKNKNFRLSNRLLEEILKLAGEQ